MEGTRSFIAVEVPQSLRAKLEGVQRELKRADADVRWVRPESIHLTLKFLGSVSGEELEKISGAIAPIVSASVPFEIRLLGLGCFPSSRNPRIVWVGIEKGSLEASSLQKAVENRAAEVGFPPETRPFKPHLTIGRVRSSRGKASLAQAVENLRDVEIGSYPVNEVFLFRSELKPSGAVYTKLQTFPMGQKE
jgi:2'-5' RNA ligase